MGLDQRVIGVKCRTPFGANNMSKTDVAQCCYELKMGWMGWYPGGGGKVHTLWC